MPDDTERLTSEFSDLVRAIQDCTTSDERARIMDRYGELRRAQKLQQDMRDAKK